ncbi:vWA domain-containing protein [Leadbettera azotonutricia]|uniref:VWFA domain-containing protein n=1 Tax=Leadbettera azotonutricia (strain ATCC BAA-888 / DSM 13862 / ZAS-9) TaxID=545695 RepID=F5YD19_LEAAZ|nr:vWA domain-containing protein [Leadbettera azotonutricia]AEF83193.1 conserved hypothetical protein [Leadbettera azotonutricia ZAS-9]
MNNNLTEIIFLLDRSGSMAGLENDTIGGFNGFVKKQAELGPAKVTTVLFDDRCEILHNGIRAETASLSSKEYFTRGNTALLDAVGKTIKDVKKRIKSSEADRPDKVIFVITTDGLENASREYTYQDIKDKIEKQTKKHGWEFIFMGANIDVAKESANLGIKADMSFCYEASVAGTAAMFSKASGLVGSLREKE